MWTQEICQLSRTFTDVDKHHVITSEQIDSAYTTVIDTVTSTAEEGFQQTTFKQFLKPYWPNKLAALHKHMKQLLRVWIEDGRPIYIHSKRTKNINIRNVISGAANDTMS